MRTIGKGKDMRVLGRNEVIRELLKAPKRGTAGRVGISGEVAMRPVTLFRRILRLVVAR